MIINTHEVHIRRGEIINDDPQRLEIDEDGWDGIACRDETIKVQDVKIAELKAENERLKALNVELTAKCNWYNSDGARLERERDELKAKLAGAIEARDWWIQEQANQVTRTNEEIDIGNELTRQLAEYKGLLSNLMEVVEEPPESNCSCHTSPPCSDCVEWSGLREALLEARTAMKGATE